MTQKPGLIDHALVHGDLLFTTQRDRCLYIGKTRSEKPDWLKENEGSWRRIEDVLQDAALLKPPAESDTKVGAAPARPNSEAPSCDVRNDSNDEGDTVLVDTLPGDCSPPYQPTQLPTPVKADAANGSTKAELRRPAKAAVHEAVGSQTASTPLGAMGGTRGCGGGHQLKKQKPPAGISKAGPKHSSERMRIVLNNLRKIPILSHAAAIAGIHRKTLEYWMKCSEAGHDGYDIKWQHAKRRFHEHCQTAIYEAHDRALAVEWEMAMGVIVKTAENGNLIEEVCGQPNVKILRDCLELRHPEKWGKNRSKYNTAASGKASKWKSRSRRIREAKP